MTSKEAGVRKLEKTETRHDNEQATRKLMKERKKGETNQSDTNRTTIKKTH